MKTATYEELDSAAYNWLKTARYSNIPISSIGVGIGNLRVWYIGMTYMCGNLGMVLILQIVRMSRFFLDPPLATIVVYCNSNNIFSACCCEYLQIVHLVIITIL